jgi:hypothetical protein
MRRSRGGVSGWSVLRCMALEKTKRGRGSLTGHRTGGDYGVSTSPSGIWEKLLAPAIGSPATESETDCSHVWEAYYSVTTEPRSSEKWVK